MIFFWAMIFALGIEAVSFFCLVFFNETKKNLAESPTNLFFLPLDGLLIGKKNKFGMPKQ